MKLKKMGAILIALCMMLTVFPTAVVHAESTQAQSTPSTINGEIEVLLPLDLDGKTPNDSKVSKINFNASGTTTTGIISSYDWKFYTADGKEMPGNATFNDVDTYKAAFSLKTENPGEYIFGENNTVAVRDYWGWYRNYSAKTTTSKDENGNTVIHAEFEFNLTRRIVNDDISLCSPITYAKLIGTHPSDWSDTIGYTDTYYQTPEGEILMFDLIPIPFAVFYTADGRKMSDNDTFVDGESYVMKLSLRTLNGDYYILSGDNNVILEELTNPSNSVKLNTTVSKDEYNNTVINAEYTFQPEGNWETFHDIKESDWFYHEVRDVYNRGIMTGYKENEFNPYGVLARAQFAVVLHRMDGKEAVTFVDKFPDISDGIWYTDAVLWAADKGIVTGYSDTGMFGPSDNIQRQQMAVMMYRYAQYKKYDVSRKASFEKFSDADQVLDYANEAMQWAVGTGIITGKDNGTRLDPVGDTSRAECAIIIQRFIKEYGQK